MAYKAELKKEQQKEVALKVMRKIELFELFVDEFENRGWYCIFKKAKNGAFLGDWGFKNSYVHPLVQKFEEETGNLVFAVVYRNKKDFDLLFAPKYGSADHLLCDLEEQTTAEKAYYKYKFKTTIAHFEQEFNDFAEEIRSYYVDMCNGVFSEIGVFDEYIEEINEPSEQSDLAESHPEVE